MLPKTHAILGLIFSAALFLIFPQIGIFGFLIILLSSVFIDVDHYLFYIFTKKDWSLKNANKWFKDKIAKARKLPREKRRKNPRHIPCLLHGIEAIIILSILSFFHIFFFYILIGFLFHELLDLIQIVIIGFPINHLCSQTLNSLRYFRK